MTQSTGMLAGNPIAILVFLHDNMIVQQGGHKYPCISLPETKKLANDRARDLKPVRAVLATLKNAIFISLDMELITSFKERVLSGIISGALSYSSLIGKQIKVKSPLFKIRNEYVLRFFPRNFLHLTGVHTSLPSMDFYLKALDGSLSLSDFDCDSSPALKGTVRCKVRNLQNIGTFFEWFVKVEEDFSSGSVRCKFATSESTYTLGFIGKSFLVPNTLLHKDKIRESKQILDFEIVIQ